MKRVIEADYPIAFRKKEASQLGEHLKHHHSVVLVGMKRVGISNFLRFFLYHDQVEKTYIGGGVTQLFVPVDLNDLVERNIYPFWTLLLTRIVDAIQRSQVSEQVKRRCRRLFVQSIQLKDLFFTVDCVQKVINEMISANLYPTLFLIRFDRLQDVITPEFFSNLHGLRDSAKQKLSYVFTSYRPLHDLAPQVFKKNYLSIFSHDMYLKPAQKIDMEVILETLVGEYHVSIPKDIHDALIDISGGYVQYLQLAVIRLREEKTMPKTREELFLLLSKDEQILFQSEELYESLTPPEKEVLLAIEQNEAIDKTMQEKAAYLWNTGMVVKEAAAQMLFSPLLGVYVQKLATALPAKGEFTKKEYLLFTYLKGHEGELCERETIIQAVWPEHEELGVSDWAIDRLIARLRSKLKAQESKYHIVTIVTRGYKLISA